jgi:hypothetical protein
VADGGDSVEAWYEVHDCILAILYKAYFTGGLNQRDGLRGARDMYRIHAILKDRLEVKVKRR